jgi:ornithine decarboxylase
MNTVKLINDESQRRIRKRNRPKKKNPATVKKPKRKYIRKQLSKTGPIFVQSKTIKEEFDANTTAVIENLVKRVAETESSVKNLGLFVQEEMRNRYNIDIQYTEEKLTPAELAQSIIDKHNVTVFSVVDLGRLIHQARLWKSFLPRIQPYYAVKSNPDLNILRILSILGVNFDCASKGEIELVLNLGAEPQQIIYANPAKGFEHILYAREKNVRLMTFDNIVELRKIVQTFPKAEVVLRISSNDTMSLLPFGYKFGARRDDAFALIKACVEMKANLVGISFHVGSGCYSPIGFIDTLHRAREMFTEAENQGLSLCLLDIGGGFPGDNEGSITFSELASAIGPVIDALFPEDIQVIAEPGRYFCTSTTTVALQVYAKRDYLARRLDPDTNEIMEIKEIQYYCPDGVYGNFNNIVCSTLT